MLSSVHPETVDRKSAYELLKERAEKAAETKKAARKKPVARRSNRQGVVEAMIKSMVRLIGSSLGRKIARGVLGSLMKG